MGAIAVLIRGERPLASGTGILFVKELKPILEILKSYRLSKLFTDPSDFSIFSIVAEKHQGKIAGFI